MLQKTRGEIHFNLTAMLLFVSCALNLGLQNFPTHCRHPDDNWKLCAAYSAVLRNLLENILTAPEERRVPKPLYQPLKLGQLYWSWMLSLVIGPVKTLYIYIYIYDYQPSTSQEMYGCLYTFAEEFVFTREPFIICIKVHG